MRADGSNTGNLSSVILGLVVLALAGTVGTVGLIRQVAEIGPKVGDIVTFDPLEALSRDMRTKISVQRASGGPDAACVLDIGALHAGGGSVVIEASQAQTGDGYRVHWAGARNSDDQKGCGTSEDLLVDRADIETLAMAAGGYGVSPKKLRANTVWSARSSAR